MTGNDILQNAGKVSHQKALDKAQIKNELSKVEKDFIKQIENTSKRLKK